METIASIAAKTRFPSLLDKVMHGEKITITRDGVPVAMLVPIDPAWRDADVQGQVREYRRGLSIDGPTVREMLKRQRQTTEPRPAERGSTGRASGQ